MVWVLEVMVAFAFWNSQCRLLQNNNISGRIPKELGYLPNLQTLDLSNNKLLGHIPQSFGFLNHLHYLWVSILFSLLHHFFISNILFDYICAALIVIVICLVMDRRLNNNSLSGSVPLSLASLPQLAFLWVFISLSFFFFVHARFCCYIVEIRVEIWFHVWILVEIFQGFVLQQSQWTCAHFSHKII